MALKQLSVLARIFLFVTLFVEGKSETSIKYSVPSQSTKIVKKLCVHVWYMYKMYFGFHTDSQ